MHLFPGWKRKHNNAFPNERPHKDKKRNFNRKPNPAPNENSSVEKVNRNRPAPKLTNMLYDQKLKPFPGIQNLILDSDEEVPAYSETEFLIEDDETNDEIPTETQCKGNAKLCGALNNLMCNYATSDEDDKLDQLIAVNKTERNISKKDKVNNIDKTFTATQNFNQVEEEKSIDDDEAPDEVKTIKIIDTGSESAKPSSTKELLTLKPMKQALQPNKYTGQINKYKPKQPSTLLQKLLFREMRQERNMVLQCVRYIVENNYFHKK